MLNEKTQRLIEEIKQILSTHYVNKEEIKKGFDNYFDLNGLPKRKVEFYENIQGWNAAQDAIQNAAPNAAQDTARHAAWYAARHTAWCAAWDAAWDVTWYAASLNNCEKNDNCKICKFIRKFCEPQYILFKNGVFIYWILKDKVIVITRPIIRHIGEKLHSETAPAIEWENEKYYFLWGVRFDKDLWEKVIKKEMSFKEIMKLKNIEQRMVALKMMDMEKLLKEVRAKLIDKSEKGNELYLVKGIFRQPAYFLKYKCPSTGRVYISGVDPQIARQNPNADYLQAWRLNIQLKEYFKLIEA